MIPKNTMHMIRLDRFFSHAFILSCLATLFSFAVGEDWIAFTAPQATMLFPRQPTVDTATVHSGPMDLTFFVAKYQVKDTATDDNLMYSFVSTVIRDSSVSSDMPDLIDPYFKGAVSSTVEKMHGVLLTEEKVELEGFPGRKIRVAVQGKRFTTTQYHWLVRNSALVLQVMTKADKEDNPSARRFLGSIKLR